MCVCVCVYLSVCLSVRPSVCPSVRCCRTALHDHSSHPVYLATSIFKDQPRPPNTSHVKDSSRTKTTSNKDKQRHLGVMAHVVVGEKMNIDE